MPIAYWCILAGALLPYVAVAAAKFSPGSGYDNARPRETEGAMTGFRARAVAAHHNGFEAFALFAVAVLAAVQLGQEGAALDRLCLAWVILRLAYTAAYCGGWPRTRSVLWTAAIGVALAILTLPAWG